MPRRTHARRRAARAGAARSARPTGAGVASRAAARAGRVTARVANLAAIARILLKFETFRGLVNRFGAAYRANCPQACRFDRHFSPFRAVNFLEAIPFD